MNKHFVVTVAVNNKLIAAQDSNSPMHQDAVQFSWWELLIFVIKFQSLTVVVKGLASPFAQGRLRGVLDSIQMVPVRRADVQSQETKPNNTREED